MKIELKYIAVMTYWLILFGVLAPTLISAASTELVIAGLALTAGSFYFTYRFVRSEIKRINNEAR